MFMKNVFFKKGHVINNVPCSENLELGANVKDIIRGYYFNHLIVANKIIVIDYKNIIQEKWGVNFEQKSIY